MQDLRFAVRMLRASPIVSIVAILSLASGIGANTAIFSIVNAVLLRPLRAPDADRLVRFAETYRGTPSGTVGLASYNTWRQQTEGFEDVAAHWSELANLTKSSYPEQIPVARVTASFFHLFGARAVMGRLFTVDDDRPGAPQVIVLSSELWRRQFGADPRVLDTAVVLGGQPRVVVGVLDAGFDSEQFDQQPAAWVPFQIDPVAPEIGQLCFVTGRLKPNVTLDAGQALVQTVAKNETRATETKDTTRSATVVPLREAMIGDVRTALLILAGAMGCVLLMACANVSGLLLIRAVEARPSMAVRAALGAGRGRIVRQVLLESLLLSVTGGTLAILLGTIVVRRLLALYPGNNDPGIVFKQLASLPRLGQDFAAVTIDWHLWLFTAAASLVTGLVAGLVPAVQAGRMDLFTALKGGRGSDNRPVGTRAGTLIVISQAALSLTLLVGSGLLIRTSLALLAVNRGFEAHDVLTLRMAVTGTPFETQAGVEQLQREGVGRLRAIPGVTVASVACCVPLETVWQMPFIVDGRPLSGRWHAFAGWTFVSAGYFEALKIPLIRGRIFTDHDDAGSAAVVIINEAMARQFWPNGDPLQDQLLVGRGIQADFQKDSVRQIVGIVGNVRDQALNRPARPAMYVPIGQLPDGVTRFMVRQLPLTWMVRTSMDAHSLRAQIERELQTVSGGLPVTRIRPMDEVVARSIGRTRFSMFMMTMFGCLSLLLAITGIYALIAFSVKARMREFGIRIALGAAPARVLRNVLSRIALVVGCGALVGTVLSLWASRFVGSLLYGVEPHDRITLVCAAITLVAVGMLAGGLPALKASRIDPAEVLRES